MADDEFKVCPFCKEKIRKEAVKCRFCGEWLEQREQEHTSSSSAEMVETPFPIQHEPPAPDGNRKAPEIPPEAEKETSSKALFCPHCKLVNPPDAVRCDCGHNFSTGKMQSSDTHNSISKTTFWISIALLSITGLVWIIGLSMVHWGQMSPAQQGEETVNLLKFFFVLGIITWFTKGKSEKLLTFSVVFAIMTAIAAYYFFDARHKAQEKAAESNRQEVDNINSLEKFIQGGATGDIPEFKPTGDADTDAFFQTTRDFYTEYIQGWRKASTDVAALQEMSISDCLLFTNKFYLEPQIQDRIAGQQIIVAFKANALSMIENYKQKCAALNVTEEYKQGILKSLDKMSPQFEAMFDASIKSQKADQAILQFLHDNFDDYEFKDGTILFATAANSQKYDELAKEVQDASAEADGFQKRGLAAIEAAKAKLQ